MHLKKKSVCVCNIFFKTEKITYYIKFTFLYLLHVKQNIFGFFCLHFDQS